MRLIRRREENLKRLIFALLVGLLALGAFTSQALAAGYTVTDLGILAGAHDCFPRGLNDNGWVVGSSTQSKIPHYKGWLWTPSTPNASTGTMRVLEPSLDGHIAGPGASTMPAS